MKLRYLLVLWTLLISHFTIVEAGYFPWQITTLSWTLKESWNSNAPLLLNWVYFNLEPLNKYYLWKKVSITVKWKSSSSFSVLSINEKTQEITEWPIEEHKIINIWIEKKIIDPPIHSSWETPINKWIKLTLKEKLLLQRKQIVLIPTLFSQNTPSKRLEDIFWDLSQKEKETTPKTLKEKLLELKKLKEIKQNNIDPKLNNFLWS